MTSRFSRRSSPLPPLPPHDFEILPPVAAASSLGKGKALMEETEETGTLDKVKELEEIIKKLEDEKYQILKGRSEMHQLKSTATKWTSEKLVIAFVEAIEKADQYIDFKKYLKREGYIKTDSDPDRIFDTFVQSPIRKELFEKIDDEIIRNAINAHITIVKLAQKNRSQYEYRIYLTRCEFIKPNSSFKDDIKAIGQYDRFPGLSSDDMYDELKKYINFIMFSPSQEDMAKYTEKIEWRFNNSLYGLKQVKDVYEATDVIYDIVFRTRQAQYTMDQNPELELEKLTNLCPTLYFDLEAELKKMLNPDLESSKKDSSSLARTVMVFGVPPHASEVDVRKSFSCCGEIESVEMESACESQIAHVTYKNSNGAEHAIDLKRTKVCNLDVKVSAGRYWRLEDCEAWDEEMKAARKVEISAEEVERLLGLMREKALKKYTDLVKLHGKDVKAERNAAVEENVCSVPSEGTKKMARGKNRKRRGRKVDVSSVPGAEAAGRTPLRDEAVA